VARPNSAQNSNSMQKAWGRRATPRRGCVFMGEEHPCGDVRRSWAARGGGGSGCTRVGKTTGVRSIYTGLWPAAAGLWGIGWRSAVAERAYRHAAHPRVRSGRGLPENEGRRYCPPIPRGRRRSSAPPIGHGLRPAKNVGQHTPNDPMVLRNGPRSVASIPIDRRAGWSELLGRHGPTRSQPWAAWCARTATAVP